MRRLSVLALPVLAAAIVACSSAAAPGWTYAPAPSATPVASGASGSPAASSSAVASAPAASASASTPSTAPSTSGGPAPSGGATLTITAPVGAATAGFTEKTLDAKAGTPLTLIFDNLDNQAPHNVILQNPDGSNVQVTGDTAFFTGPGQRTYQVPALQPGTYKYMCQVHPTTMNGVLTVK